GRHVDVLVKVCGGHYRRGEGALRLGSGSGREVIAGQRGDEDGVLRIAVDPIAVRVDEVEVGAVLRAGMYRRVVVVAVRRRQPAVAIGVTDRAAQLCRLLRGAAVVGLVSLLDQLGAIGAGEQEVGPGLRAPRQRQGRLAGVPLASAECRNLAAAYAGVVLAPLGVGREVEDRRAAGGARVADIVDSATGREALSEGR